MLKYIDKMFPSFIPIKNEKIWLYFYEKIREPSESKTKISNAEKLLPHIDKYDKYVGNVFIKTIFSIVVSLRNEKHYFDAYKWLTKLDQSEISSISYNPNYISDRKFFILLLSDLIIQLGQHSIYINSCLDILNYKDTSHTKFVKYIINDITYYDYTTYRDSISVYKFARYIKIFQEEIHLRKKTKPQKMYNPNKILLISDLSHFSFCPVSFAINLTFSSLENSSLDKNEWINDKILFVNRYKKFKKDKNFQNSFDDYRIFDNSQLKTYFEYFFNSSIIVNNATNPSPTVYSNKNNTLRGAPDYLMEDKNKVRYAITEKFSNSKSANSEITFESDLIKHYAFLDELEELKLSYGFLITWLWELKIIENTKYKKKIISSVRVEKVEPNPNNSRKLKTVINNVLKFKTNNSMIINADRISKAKKCLNCSVVSYCHHKTGNYSDLSLPYNLDVFKITEEPNIKYENNKVSNNIF